MKTHGLVRIIVNPFSGRGQDPNFTRELMLQLYLRRFPVELSRIAGPGDGQRLARETPDDAACVVSIGGDGTHRAVIAGMLGRRVPVCVVPGGTENVLAKTFGLTGTVRHTVELILRRHLVDLDIGLVNGEPFVMFTGVGFDAAVTRRVHAKRNGPFHRAAYYAVIGKMVWRYRFPRLRVSVDGEPICDDAGFVLVANTPQYAGRMRIARHAVANDGLLDVVCFQTQSRVHFVAHYVRMKLGTHLRHPEVTAARGEVVTVTSDGQPADAEADGDWIAMTPLVCRLRPRAIRLLAPEKRLRSKYRIPRAERRAERRKQLLMM